MINHGNGKYRSILHPNGKYKVPLCSIFKCASHGSRAVLCTSHLRIRFFWNSRHHHALRAYLLPAMPGKKGASGGWRPGAGRKPGATAIKKKGKGKATKKAKAAAPEPSKASAKFLATFLVKKAAAAPAAANVLGSPYPAALGAGWCPGSCFFYCCVLAAPPPLLFALCSNTSSAASPVRRPDGAARHGGDDGL